MKYTICTILSALLVAFLIIYLCIEPSTWPNANAPVLPGPPKQDYEKIEKKMYYHGVKFAEMNLTGQWYFYRNNKKCKLK